MRACVLLSLLVAAEAVAAPRDGAWSPRVGREPPASAPEGGDAPWLYAQCGPRSVALETIAARLAEAPVGVATKPTSAEIGRAVQAAGIAHPWPRAWAMTATPAVARERFERWLVESRGVRRCGVSERAYRNGDVTIAAVTVDAMAELTPLQRQVRIGTWVPLEASLGVEASDAAVVLLGPDGVPRRVPADYAAGVVRSRFNLDSAGPWTVQVLATLEGGPEPVLEAKLFAGVAPSFERRAAVSSPLADDARLLSELNSARGARALAPLRRASSLDAVAKAHASRMAASGVVAHDAGDGDPVERVRAAGLDARLVGENVARAHDAAGAHQALWESPSHRGNMLSSRYRRVGIGVVRDARGLWVTQLFAD